MCTRISRARHGAADRYTIRRMRVLLLQWIVAAAVLSWARPATAALGEQESSIAADQAHLRASTRVTRADGYTLHEMRSDSGTVVREYASPTGTVFAVSWQGPFLPDMKQLLGAHFDEYARATKARRRRGPIVVREPGLVVEMSGHPRSFSGRAYVPDLVPPGVAPPSP
jgi:hypothetical protein